jgi:lipopolysaccharide export system protein LptA
MTRRLLLGICLLLTPLAAESQARGAPGGRCTFQFFKRYATDPRLAVNMLPSGARHIFLGGGVRAVCAAQSITVIADSMESYEDTRITHLIGNVHYTEPRLTLEANRLTYWENEERLRAEVDVDATLPSGTSLTGPVVEYFRAARGLRARSRMVAPQRPTIHLIERDSAGRTTDPVRVVANTVVMEADSLVYASGNVVLTRPDMVARGDSAFVDNGTEFARLMRQPVVEGKGERPFTLTGRIIDVYGRNRQLERALSRGEAKAVSDSTTITADTLDFRLVEAQLERAFAWGASRARVTSPTYDVLADSLDVRMPEQRVERVYAVGGAFIESDPDSTRFRSAERDWLRGDTIIAQFDTSEAARRDTSGGIAIEQLDAVGNARSFYQLVPRDTTAGRPAINYVTGRAITVAFEDRQVERVSVLEQASGVYLEPGESAPTPAGPSRDTTATRQAPRSPAPANAGRQPPRSP